MHMELMVLNYAVASVDASIKDKIFKVNLNSDKLPFDDKKFDVIGSFYSVEHIHNIDYFSSEIHRTLKDTGLGWFLTPNVGKEGRNHVDVFTNTFEVWEKNFYKK